MKKIFFLAMLGAAPAWATPITVTLTDDEQATMAQAIDAYVKAGGLNVVARAAALLQTLQSALTPPKPPETPPK